MMEKKNEEMESYMCQIRDLTVRDLTVWNHSTWFIQNKSIIFGV